jgi:hypothetical protein
MSTSVGPRHNHLRQKIPVGKVPTGKRNARKEEKMTNEEKMTEIAQSAGTLFAFTIDPSTAQVVKLETLDASGARRELSEEEKASLAQAGTEGGLEEFVEKAFEAGIACVLGDDESPDRGGEPADEAELRHLLLAPLMEHSPVKRLMQREALNRAILGTLIQHATNKAPAVTESGPTAGPQSERAAPARAN